MLEQDFHKSELEKERHLREQLELQLQHAHDEILAKEKALREARASIKKNQKSMINSEKMASLGVLSAGVAHEINNPIGFIYSNFCTMSEGMIHLQEFFFKMDQLITTGTDIETVRDAWKQGMMTHDIEYLLMDFTGLTSETIDGLKRVKQIVADLRSFTREDTSEQDIIDVNECVRSAVNIMSNQTKYRAHVEVEYGELPKIRGYFGKLNQVFTNMIANANQAIADNGMIRIQTSVQDDTLLITFEDNGCGISEEHLQLLFTPFFTTKPIGEGTGLGLSLSHGYIQEHNGEIRVESELGVGTTFSILLPISDGI